ncbi:acyl-ACP thioesterase [Nocardiopsis sp. MG754419]|nr:acyl-ACP thioesterase [Nocardiopsis sp. MG754419]
MGLYRLHARLGEDACARVYLASAPGRPTAALKVVRSDHTSDPDFRESFARLVERARGLRSPYVAPVLDADTARATPWVAVARPPGPTLAATVREHGPLPTEALRPLALALAQGLADLHAADHVHGALSPDGVLLAPHAALIVDPGFERAVAETSRRAPHPTCAPPEGALSTAADVFAWGATLALAASGTAGPAGVDRVPHPLRGLLESCLQTDPRLRPAATDLVGMLGGPGTPGPWPTALRTVIAGSEEETRRVMAPAPEPTAAPRRAEPRPSRRRRALLVAAGSAALLLIAAGAARALWPTTEPPAEAAAPDTAEAAGCPNGADLPAPAEEIGVLDAMNVAFSPDGDLLAVTDRDHGLSLWDWRKGVEVARPATDVHRDGDPVFAPVGCTIAVTVPHEVEGHEEPVGGVSTFDVASGEEIGRPDPPSSGTTPYLDRVSAFSPDGDRLVIALGGGYERFTTQDTFALVDLATGEIERTWGAERILDLAYTEDGRIAAVGADGFTLWDPDTGENLRTEAHLDLHRLALIGGTDEVVLVDADDGRTVRWDYEQRTETDIPDLPELEADPYAVLSHVTVDPDRARLHVGWVTDPDSLNTRYSAAHSGIEFTNHGALVDLESGENLLADQGEHALARPLAVHPNGEVIAAIAQNGEVNLVDAESLEILHPLR